MKTYHRPPNTRIYRDDIRSDPGQHERPHKGRPRAAAVAAVNDFGSIGTRLAQLEQNHMAADVVATPVAAVFAGFPKDTLSPEELAFRARRGDNLMRIRGIGVLNQKKLNALGYFRYADIAAWDEVTIAAIEEKMLFSGRIRRESWVEQAAILAVDGTTEFSAMVDQSSHVPPRPSSPAAATAAALAAAAVAASRPAPAPIPMPDPRHASGHVPVPLPIDPKTQLSELSRRHRK